MSRRIKIRPEDSEIRRRRKTQGFSLHEAASAAALDPMHLSRVERGMRSLSVSSMLRLAKVLDVDPEWLAEQLETIESARALP